MRRRGRKDPRLVVVGVDVGQGREPSAICVAEAEKREGSWPNTHFLIRHLERLPAGTSYPQVAERVASVTHGAIRTIRNDVEIYVDATGLGEPIVELIWGAVMELVVPVYFTHGDRRIVDRCSYRHTVSLGKAYLVARLQTLLQGGRLHLPKTPEAEVLTQELLDYEIQVDENANDRYGAFTVGTQDDLVTALGLAVQVDPYPR